MLEGESGGDKTGLVEQGAFTETQGKKESVSFLEKRTGSSGSV